jgi:hypothetical protein
MLKTDFFKRLGVLSLSAPLVAQAAVRADAQDDADALIGLWEAVVTVQGGSFRYIYSMSRGAYVATGNIDENFMNFKYSPTMGSYTRHSDGSYKYREHGYVFDIHGKNVGTFRSIGTFTVDGSGDKFHGPGTFTQLDLHSKVVASEKFTLTAKRLPV